jgi:hypothetical protein
MTTLSMVSMRSVSKAQTGDHSIKTIALFTFIGLVGSICLVMLGVDLDMSASLL